jgi:predicted unusual protein kinase regulating ubiquinone biosynthesis (AarF/ABC1/UbiB family)
MAGRSNDQAGKRPGGGRIQRYARVSAAVGETAARMAGERLFGIPVDRARHAADLTAALGGLKGPLMKVAQILSTIPDALPAEYVTDFAQLQANAPPMGWPFVRRRMAAELGPDWQQRFAGFERKAAAAASLGQVHRATELDGTKLACKLQYPDMESVIESDLGQLKLIFAIFRRFDRAIDPAEVHAELSERLREEIDYEREARHMVLYRRILGDGERVHVPVPYPDLSTQRLLTMSWVEGEPIRSCVDAHPDLRNEIARNLFRAWYAPFYGYGVIHGDPHLGNYTARPDGSVNLLDFGCVRVFKASFVKGVINLYRAIEQDDRELAVHAFETWGFDNLSNEIVDTLILWARFLYEPLLDDRTRRIQERGSGVYGRGVAEKVHAELHRLGGVKPPREFVLMDRAAIGLGSAFLHLRAELNWHRLFQELTNDFDEQVLERRQKQALDEAGLLAPE